jgi:pimeloyl-ACP methyl ester carboxylesterase
MASVTARPRAWISSSRSGGVAGDQAAQPLGGTLGPDQPRSSLVGPLHGPAHQGADQVVLLAEVAVGKPLADPGRDGDIRHRRGHALAGEGGPGPVKDPGPGVPPEPLAAPTPAVTASKRRSKTFKALLDHTHAHNVFGHSVGAVIAIEAARTLPAITKLALYEPPLEFDGITHTAWLPRYEREMAAGRLAAALVTIMKGTADRTAFRLIPRFLLTTAFGLAISRAKGRPVPAGVTSPRDIISTMHNDAQTVRDAAGPLDRFAGLSCDVLLLGGSRSARNLAAPLDGLSAVLPRADRVTLPRACHTAPSNNGKPQLVAAHLRAFFG